MPTPVQEQAARFATTRADADRIASNTLANALTDFDGACWEAAELFALGDRDLAMQVLAEAGERVEAAS